MLNIKELLYTTSRELTDISNTINYNPIPQLTRINNGITVYIHEKKNWIAAHDAGGFFDIYVAIIHIKEYQKLNASYIPANLNSNNYFFNKTPVHT